MKSPALSDDDFRKETIKKNKTLLESIINLITIITKSSYEHKLRLVYDSCGIQPTLAATGRIKPHFAMSSIFHPKTQNITCDPTNTTKGSHIHLKIAKKKKISE